MALANAIRAFCPPERVIPFSPTIVSSPFYNNYKSAIRQESLKVLLYLSWLNSEPKSILSLTEAENSTGSCST